MDFEMTAGETTDDGGSFPPQGVGDVTIDAEVSACVNYASWQNSAPLLRSVTIRNGTSETLEGLRLEFETVPGFTRPKHWVIDRVGPGDAVVLRDRDVQLDPGYLHGLNEAERGVATFRLFQQDRLLTEAPHEIRVLASDEWGGIGSMGSLIAAFVQPNDPAITGLLKSAGEVLAKHGHSSALDGYQSRDPRRAYLLTAAIWSAVAEKSLTYANPPKSFEQVGQKTRRPGAVLGAGLATCLDSTLLFAAAIEAIGLNPIIVMTEGHCFAGAWLVEKALSRLIEEDCSEIRKAIAAKELVTFETTMITGRPPARFEDAVRNATNATRESVESSFVAAVDISRARMAQIRPLASHEPAKSVDASEEINGAALPLPPAPDFGSVAPEEVEETPTTAEGRIDRWQRKLLDLSLRNRLLNCRSGQQSVPFLCPDISRLEDRLADGAKIRVISAPEENPIGDRDLELHQQSTNQDLEMEFARQALERDELASPLSGSELTKSLTNLYRKVRNDLSEGGSNTLFLAIGFLKWKRSPDDVKSYRAPLLLVPVQLTRKSALSPFRLSLHEDEVRFNATLIQLLKKDFDRDLSRFESDLPTDQSGVDVPYVLDQIRREIRDIPGFEVVDETILSTFSFAKYLMWKDLVDRIDQLEKNRVVRHLIRDPDKPFESAGEGFPHPHEVDVRFEPREMIHPLPADSSQLAAVMAASQGQDFVLVGPPGTGKSQTIANMIAQCLATGKTVLFVAEKTAALDVVYRRLREHGLGNCCLELHSNKAERRSFLDQLDTAWQQNRRRKPSEWLTVSDRLKVRRDELNAYVVAIHECHPNGWTAFDGYGIAARGSNIETPTFDWSDSVTHDREAYERLAKAIDDLSLIYKEVDWHAALPMVQSDQWSASWESKLLTECDRLKSTTEELQPVLSTFRSAIGLLNKGDASLQEIDDLRRLAKALIASAGDDATALFHKQFAKFPKAAKALRNSILGYRQALQSAAADYEASIEQIPVDEIEAQWRQAVSAFWPMSWLAKRRVRRLLQSYATGGQADPAIDLAAIREMQRARVSIQQSLLANQTVHWNGHETDVEAMSSCLERLAELRQAIIAVGKPASATQQVSRSLVPTIKSSRSDLPILEDASALLEKSEQFLTALRRYEELAGASPLEPKSDSALSTTLRAVDHLRAHRTQLQRWTAWCGIKGRAGVLGLSPFVRELEAGRIMSADLADQFRLAYARWWLPKVIDRNDVLRTFQRFRHEEAIADFRRLDDLARETAPSYVLEGVAHELPTPEGTPRRSELGLLRHQIGLTRPSKSIREVISGMPGSFSKLAPCVLMSPLSIAQYLPAGQPPFDIVIFDEASQITTWDAIGAIARGHQTIIVGDPKQLPPTNFFGRSESDEDDEELADHEKDLESILDEAKASGLPTLQLNWHYRSRHESLIAFSNHHYYGNKLVTFPAAESEDRGVSFFHLPDAVYDRGKSRTNRAEAEAIVRDAVARMKRWLTRPENERLTFGVVTFNKQQQSLIQDLFDQAQRDDPELDWYFSDDRIEPTVVKNLENVQGDERDVIFFSICFGPNAAGKVPLDFGALNRDGGERRLNVAVTRARQELIVYASFTGDQMNVERSPTLGVHHLKHFLEYAEKGPTAIAAQTEGSVSGFDSPFEEAVSEALVSRGWQVVPQVGVSGFRVDLGIVHPDKPGAYLAGVECDGATYHRSAVARDRDKTRQQILEGLGWNILRVWSPDWWYDAQAAIGQIQDGLEQLLSADRESAPVPSHVPTGGNQSNPTSASQLPTDEMSGDTTPTDETPKEVVAVKQGAALVASRHIGDAPSEIVHEPTQDPIDDGGVQESSSEYRIEFRRVSVETDPNAQERFFEGDYSATLRSLVLEMLEQEGPLREDVLIRQVARVHGFARTGSNIRRRVREFLQDVPSTEESTGRFLWTGDEPKPVIDFRHSRGDTETRPVDEIPLAELRGLVQANPHLLTDEDPVPAIARSIGVGRVTKSVRARLEEAISASG